MIHKKYIKQSVIFSFKKNISNFCSLPDVLGTESQAVALGLFYVVLASGDRVCQAFSWKSFQVSEGEREWSLPLNVKDCF